MKENFSALDAFRGLAALIVCAYHVPQYWGFELPRAPLAVDLFFLLSGFVIGHSYGDKLAEGRLTTRSFMLVRIIRLYPLYLLSLLVAAALTLTGLSIHHPLGSPHLIREYAAAAVAAAFVLPLHISATAALFPLNVAYWSLFFEFINNLCYALLHRQLTDRVLVAIVVTAGTALAAIAHANGSGGIILGSFWGVTSLLGGLARSVFGFFAGLLLFRWRAHLPGRGWGMRGCLIALTVVTGVLVTPAIGRVEWLFELFVVFVVFPACIAAVVCGPQAAYRSPVLRALGLASYPIYVLHVPLAHALDILTFKRLGQFAPLGGLAMTLLVLAVAIIAAYKVDMPVRRYLSTKVLHGVPASPALLKVS